MAKERVVARQSMTEWLSLVARGIVKAGYFVSIFCFIGISGIMIVNVALRYIILRPLYWGDEVMIYLMIVMAYLGFGFVLTEGEHIRVTIVFNTLPVKVQNVLWVIISLLGICYACLLLYAMVDLVLYNLEIGHFSVATTWPIAPWQMAMALGSFLLLVAFIMLVVARIGIALGKVKEKEAPEKITEIRE